MPSLEQLRQLLESEPDDVFLNFGLAMELTKAERYDEGLAQFSRVLELDPDYVAAHFQRGKALIRMGEPAAAKVELQKGVERAKAIGDRHAEAEMSQLLEAL